MVHCCLTIPRCLTIPLCCKLPPLHPPSLLQLPNSSSGPIGEKGDGAGRRKVQERGSGKRKGGRKRAGDSGGERVIGVKGGGEAEFVLMEITYDRIYPQM